MRASVNRVRPKVACAALLGFVVLALPINRSPLGSEILREFGARPSNIFLALYGLQLWFANRAFLRKTTNGVGGLLSFTFIMFLTLATLNVVVIFGVGNYYILGRSPLIQWFLQYLTVVFFIIGVNISTAAYLPHLQNIESGRSSLMNWILVAAVLNLGVFGVDLLIQGMTGSALSIESLSDTLEPIRGKLDPRASGLSSEPSVFSAWATFLWPLLWFYGLRVRGLGKRGSIRYLSVAGLLIVAATASGARSFLVVFYFQCVVYMLLSAFSRGFKHTVLVAAAATTIMLLIAIMVSSITDTTVTERLNSTVSLEENMSTLNRTASIAVALDIAADHPLTGVGIGQYTAYYSSYLPDWALVSDEALANYNGDIDTRISTFNLYARIAAEMGIPALAVFIVMISILFLLSFRSAMRSRNPCDAGVLLCFLGGTLSWLTQDLFTYTPAILAVGLVLAMKKYERSNVRARKALV
jgi:O-antigen ligase